MNNELTRSVPIKILELELNELTLSRVWRDLEIHFVQKKTHPNVVYEANRISSLMFNLDCIDGDIFDDTYRYIIVYDRVNGEIVSFYRYILCRDAIHNKYDVRLSTAKYFNFYNEFIEKILPATIEFGRSVVNKTARKSTDGLEAVWIGLGIVAHEYHLYPKDVRIEYFFGKVSLQWNVYTEAARNMILFLYQKHFPPVYCSDGEIYLKPRLEFETLLDFTEAKTMMNCEHYKSDRKILMTHLGNLGLSIPKLVDSYANLGGLKSFGTINNNHLKSWETAILQKIDEIDPCYIKRFISGYVPTNPNLFI